MLKLIIVISLIVCPILSFGQFSNNTNRKDSANIYYRSLNFYLDFIKKEYKTSFDTLFIEDDYEIRTDSLLKQIGDTKLVVLNTQNLINKLKFYNGITLYRIFPLEFENNEFQVSFVPFSVRYNKHKRRFTFSNPGSYFVFFHFENGLFKFIRVEDHGI